MSKNNCLNCGKEIKNVSKRCSSCAAKKRWKNPNERKEQSRRIKKYFEDPKHREKQSIRVKKQFEGDLKRREEQSCRSKEYFEDLKNRERISRKVKKYFKDPKIRERMSIESKKLWEDPKYREKQSIALKKKCKDSKYREKQSRRQKKAWENPSDERLSNIDNCRYGTKCYSNDGLSFPSLQERECYYWLRDILKVAVKKFGRFDFIINNKIVLEYHTCKWFLENRTCKQYYKDRRKLLDKLKYKDLLLIVMINLKDSEKKRVSKILEEI